jgi:aspartyl-tRNA(Asn)/glutamyl-tRNA(Gln) amidotransferase subunit A
MPSDFSDPLVAAGAVPLGVIFAAQSATPVDALNAYLERIDRLNPALNAFLHLDLKGAADAAEASRLRWARGAPRSPLDGAPIGVKANIAVAGLPWHAGIAAYRDRLAEHDAACVTRLREAGAVILGVLNMHEAALGATNDNAAFGRCHNPHRHDYTPGGSSGGSAAAVAAGLCAAALGTDTLGSVRIPASYCGVFGHKPAHGAVPTEGVIPLSPTLDDIGVLARSAQDCRAVLEVIGPAALGPRATRDRDSPIRCAVIGLSPSFGLDAGIIAALGATIDGARRSGVEVELLQPDWDAVALQRLSLLIVEIEALAEHRSMLALKPEGFSAPFRSMLDWAASQPASKVARAYSDMAAAAQDIRGWLADFDAVLLPTTASPAFRFDEPTPADQADFTLLANLAGLAATAFPVGVAANGLPLSLQIFSQSDAMALELAQRFSGMSRTPRTARMLDK